MNLARTQRMFSLSRAVFGVSFAAMMQYAAASGSTNVVIAEIYGGGGNPGAVFQNDYVVLFNRGNSYQDITGWSLQYQSQGSSNWSVVSLASSVLPSGGYHLIQLASGGADGAPLPPAETYLTSLNISSTRGKLALVSDGATLSAGCTADIRIVDKVGYGITSVTCNESSNAPSPSDTHSIQRKFSGCKDTDNNSVDFVLGSPSPRNSLTSSHFCGSGLPPDMLVRPRDQYACAGDTVTFYVQVDGDPFMDFYWYSNNVQIFDGIVSTETNSSLTISNVQLFSDGAQFNVYASNPYGYTNSGTNFLFVSVVPIPGEQPTNQTVAVGDPIQLSVTAFPPPLQYSWWFEGRALTNDARVLGADSPNLTILNAQMTDAGYYRAVMSNSCFVLNSVSAQCQIGAPPLITNEPYSQVAPFKTNVQFVVGASEPPTLFYQWYRNDIPISGATTSILALAQVERPDVGVYHAVVHNGLGAAVSDRVHLQIELTFEESILHREEATDNIDSLTNVLRNFALPPTVLFRGAPLLFTTYDGTAQPWETIRCGVPPSHSMWILYFSRNAQMTRVSTEGSDFDTVLAVYSWTGNSSDPLEYVACNDNGGFDGRSSVMNFPALANKDYYILVDGVKGATGTARVQIGETIRNVRSGDGKFRFEMAGPFWYTTALYSSSNLFSLQGSPVLTVPATNRDWVLSYTNSNISAEPRRFYRSGFFVP